MTSIDKGAARSWSLNKGRLGLTALAYFNWNTITMFYNNDDIVVQEVHIINLSFFEIDDLITSNLDPSMVLVGCSAVLRLMLRWQRRLHSICIQWVRESECWTKLCYMKICWEELYWEMLKESKKHIKYTWAEDDGRIINLFIYILYFRQE